MLLSQSPFRSLLVLLTALMTTGLLFTASTAHASRGNPVVYTAELVNPVEADQHIIRGTVISCAGNECRGAKSSSSVRTICAKLADKVGPLASFAYKGEVMSAEALAKCNS